MLTPPSSCISRSNVNASPAKYCEAIGFVDAHIRSVLRLLESRRMSFDSLDQGRCLASAALDNAIQHTLLSGGRGLARIISGFSMRLSRILIGYAMTARWTGQPQCCQRNWSPNAKQICLPRPSRWTLDYDDSHRPRFTYDLKSSQSLLNLFIEQTEMLSKWIGSRNLKVDACLT